MLRLFLLTLGLSGGPYKTKYMKAFGRRKKKKKIVVLLLSV